MLTFTGVVEGFVVNFLKKNFWRVQRTFEYEDAMQEAALVFQEVKTRYQDDVDNDAWMMSLFKTAWHNRFTDMAQSDYGHRQMPCLSDMGEDQDVFLNKMVMEDPSQFVMLMKEIPEGVRQVLSVLANAPSELLEQAAIAWVEQGHNKVDGNAHLCRLLDMDPKKVNIVEITRRHFA